MDGIVGKIDRDGCDDCKNWDGDICVGEVEDYDLKLSMDDSSVKCTKYLSREDTK